MKIYKLVAQEMFNWVEEGSYRNKYNSQRKVIGSRLKLINKEISLKYIDKEGLYCVKEESDLCLSNIHEGNFFGYYFDDYAYETLKDLFDDTCEFYPARAKLDKLLSMKSWRYKLLHIKEVVHNAVNYEKSDISWLSEKEKRASYISKFKINEKSVEGKHIFTIAELLSSTFVSEKFKRRCEEKGITGLGYKLIYDSDDESVRYIENPPAKVATAEEKDEIRLCFSNYDSTTDVTEIYDMMKKSFDLLKDIGINKIYNIEDDLNKRIEFDLSDREAVLKELEDNWDKDYPEMGTYLKKSYFLSEDEKYKGEIRFQLGLTNCRPMMSANVITISKKFSREHSCQLVELLKKYIELHNPFDGWLSDRSNLRETKTFLMATDIERPGTVQWVSYWNNKIIDKVGVDEIEKAGFYKIEKLENGYLLILQENPINNEDAEEIANQRKVMDSLSEYVGY